MASKVLIGFEKPTAEDVQAIEGYEAAKKNKKLSLEPLSELAKGSYAASGLVDSFC